MRHPMPPDVLLRALNARLPRQVRVLAAEWRQAGFSARFDAKGKTYRYLIDAGAVADPFAARWAWHVPQALDTGAMQEALASLVGTHDFAAFQSTGGDVETTVRTLYSASCRLERLPADAPSLPGLAGAPRVIVEVSGDGFLRHMVRAIVGTLVEIGRGQRPAGELARVLAFGDRTLAGPTAPAHGLCLVTVRY
jgi:tRNA pseudouridine38-40 synthase